MSQVHQLTHDGVAHSLPYGWGVWHVQMLYLARRFELTGIPKTASLDDDWNHRQHAFGSYTFTQRHGFLDPDDGERFEILPGTTHTSWRS